MLYKQDLGVARTVIVQCYRCSINYSIPWFNGKSHPFVKRDGALIHRRGAGSDGRSPVLMAKLVEAIEQHLAQSLLAVAGVDAAEVDIGLVGAGRGEESYKETDHPAIVLQDERGVPEMKQEDPGQAGPDVAATPPIGHHRYDCGVVGGRGGPDAELVFNGWL